MPLTHEQIAKIRKKEAETPQALRRDPIINYYEGWFFVTLNTRDGVPVLSIVDGDANVPDGHEHAPRCRYTSVGRGVIEAWKMMPSIHPNVEIDLCEAMPEHFHGLVHLLPGNKRHLGIIIRGFMIGCSHAYWDTLGIAWRNMTNKDGVITPQYNDRDHTMSYRGPALFVRGYNDMEPITPEEIEIKRQYIRDQARKRLIQGENHRCFTKHRHKHSKNWTLERALLAIATDRVFRYDAQRRDRAMANVKARLNTDAQGICLDHIGASALLAAQRKLPLICHSIDAPYFEHQKAAVINAARSGAVIVSAFISPKERDIKEQLMREQLPFVEIIDNGMPERYKGIGRAFYALAEGRLCQITPWRYEYQKDVKVTREMCMVMNELARVVSGVPDDWWNTPNQGGDTHG